MLSGGPTLIRGCPLTDVTFSEGNRVLAQRIIICHRLALTAPVQKRPVSSSEFPISVDCGEEKNLLLKYIGLPIPFFPNLSLTLVRLLVKWSL